MTTNRQREAGFTIIEVMIAVVILTVGLLGLTATSALVTRMLGRGQRSEISSRPSGVRWRGTKATL